MTAGAVWPNLLQLDPDDPGLRWQDFHDGVDILPLHGTPAGCFCALLRYRPGAQIPAHVHSGFEHILVLRGSQSDQRGTHQPGTLLISEPGSSHGVRSEAGCLALAIWGAPVVFL